MIRHIGPVWANREKGSHIRHRSLADIISMKPQVISLNGKCHAMWPVSHSKGKLSRVGNNDSSFMKPYNRPGEKKHVFLNWQPSVACQLLVSFGDWMEKLSVRPVHCGIGVRVFHSFLGYMLTSGPLTCCIYSSLTQKIGLGQSWIWTPYQLSIGTPYEWKFIPRSWVLWTLNPL